MKKNRLFVFGILFMFLFVLALGLVAFFGDEAYKYWESVTYHQEDRTLVVGSMNFTENIIWAHIIAQMVRANSDIEVKLIEDMGIVEVAKSAIKSGYIQVYPEYLGTIYSEYLGNVEKVGAEKMLRTVQREMVEKFQIRVLDPYGFNNTYAIGMLRPRAEEPGH